MGEDSVSNELTAYGAVELGQQQFELIASKDKLVSWAEESQFAVQLLNKNAMLQQCAPQSIQESITNVAAIGLSLNPAYGYAYLVPDSIKSGQQWVKVCQLRVSFKGLVKIAVDSGAIKFVRAEIVKENDVFTYNGPMAAPVHQMNPFGDRGKVVGVYCIAKTPDGEILTDVMGIDDINKIRAAAKQDGVWAKWFEEMAKKAIIKRASKHWPLGNGADRFNTAVSVVNDIEGSETIERDVTPKQHNLPNPITEEQVAQLVNFCGEKGVTTEQLCERAGTQSVEEIPAHRFEAAKKWVSNHA
jgi:recombination protein RecT